MSFSPENFLCLLLAALIGWLVGWLLGRLSRSRPAESLDVESAGKLRLCEEERNRLHVEIADLKTKIIAFEAAMREHEATRTQLTVATTDLDEATAAIGERNKLREEVERLRQQLRTFETTSADINNTIVDRDVTIASLKRRSTELEWLKWNLKNVVFPVDSPEITAEAKSVLEEVVPVLKQLKHVVVEIGGHTDNIDSEKHNRDLSLQRAEAVREYLVKCGVPSELLATVGYGASRPIANNGTEEGRQRNRRIEFVVKH